MGFVRKGTDNFASVEWRERDGLPELPGIQGCLACDVEQIVAGGDHMMITGLVTAASCRDADPLVYRERTFWRLASESGHAAGVTRAAAETGCRILLFDQRLVASDRDRRLAGWCVGNGQEEGT